MTTTTDFLAQITDPRLKAQALSERDRQTTAAAYDGLSEGEHPDVLEDAYAAEVAAHRAAQKAYTEYTNPFGVSKTVPASWPREGLAPGLVLG